MKLPIIALLCATLTAVAGYTPLTEQQLEKVQEAALLANIFTGSVVAAADQKGYLSLSDFSRAVRDLQASFPYVVVAAAELGRSAGGNSLPLVELGLASSGL